MTTIVRAARALVSGKERKDFAFAVDADRIAMAAPFAQLSERYPDADIRVHGEDAAIIPGLVNGHSHAYQILMRGRADDLPFAKWRSDYLYKLVPPLTPERLGDLFRRAFREMLASGVTTAAEFFYLNGAGNERAEAAIEAARETGIRLVFARCWMDAPQAPPEFRETIEAAAARTRELAKRYPDANVCVAPHSVHGASLEMIRAASRFAKEAGTKLHIHLGEREPGQVRLLKEFGALDERVVAIHAIHIDEEEKRMLAESGASVVHNPVTNQYLGDGICDVTGLRKLGVKIGLGTDANIDASILAEMRCASLLQKLAHRDSGVFDAPAAFQMGTSEGAAALGIDAGDFREGAFADYAVAATDGVDPWSPLLNALVYRAQTDWIRETYVGGRRVYSEVGSLK